MAIASERPASLKPARPEAETIEASSPRPVIAWAVVGAVVLAITAYLFIAWVTGPNFVRVRPGPSEVPTYMKWAVRVQETSGVIFLSGMLYWFIVRPWRRERRLTFNGIFLLAMISVEWQDPLYNYMHYGFMNNAYALNMGTWMMYIPGWLSPNPGHYAEDVVMFGTFYGSVMFFGAMATAWAMRRFKARRPQTGTFGLMLYAFTLVATVDFIIEFFYMRLGMYFYTQVWEPATLWYGHYYQFPIYESITLGVAWASFACILYFVNDKGETVAERGLERLKVSRRQAMTVRALAMIGIVNAGYFVFYNVPNIFATMHASPWIEDHLKRSYVTNHVCGDETEFACDGGPVPTGAPSGSMGGKSIHLDPDGRLVVPPGVELPKNVPYEKK